MDKHQDTTTQPGQDPNQVITRFCTQYKQTSAINKLWLMTQLSTTEDPQKLTGTQKEEFEQYTRELTRVLTAIYQIHNPNNTHQPEQEGSSHA